MSIERGQEEKKLSRAVLDLKFMKKSKEKREILDDAEERQQLYQDQLSLLHEGADRIVMLNSYFDCKKFLPCRLSFGGMDPDIEKLNEDKLTGLYKVVKREDSPPEGKTFTGMNADVDEEEMAESCLATNMKKKFGIKRKSELEDFDLEENSITGTEHGPTKDKKPKRMPPGASERKLFTVDIEGKRGRGSGMDFRGRGRGDFRGRGRGDFGGRGRGDFRGRGRGDFRGRGRGDFKGRGGGNFRGRGDSRGRGRGEFRGRGRGDSRGRGRGDFRGRGDSRGGGDFHRESTSYDDQNGSFNEDGKGDFVMDCDDLDIDISHQKNKKMKFMKPDMD